MLAEWVSTTLGEVAEFSSGGTPSKSWPGYWGGAIPWVSAKDMKRFRLDDTEDHITEDGAANGTRLVPSGTVLLLVRGMTLINDVPICIANRPMAFNQDVKALRPKTHVLGAFLPYLLIGNKDRLLSLVDLAGHGTGRLNSDELKAFDVLLPPLPEQRRIACILGALDDKIELNRRMNRTLEEIAQAIFKSWFIDFDGQDDLVDSELGLVPRGWEVGKLGETVDVHGGGTPSTKIAAYWDEGIIHWATPKDLSPLTSPVLLSTRRKITPLGLGTISSGLLPSGTLLLSSRAPVGYLAIADVPVAVNQGFIAIPPGGKLSNLYMLRWLAANMERLKAHAGGTTFQEISKRDFRPITVIVPPATEVARFDSVSGPMLRRVVGNEKQSATLTALRDALLPKLISGEIRVPEAEQILEDAL